MPLDFTPILADTAQLFTFAQQFTRDDLHRFTDESVDFFLGIVRQADDAAIVFIPDDSEADDPGAAEGEQHIGWGIGHLVVHTTASAEEYAAISSLLARGVAYGREPRLRYETHWRTITTQAQCIARLEESRRIRHAYLNAWPDQPHFDLLRDLSDGYRKRFGEQNALACFVMGLYHDSVHYEQVRAVLAQAQAALQA